MKKNDARSTVKISFKNAEYKIDKEKLIYVLQILEKIKEDKPIVNIESDEEICRLMEKHKLYDDSFLEKMSKL